MTVDKFRITDGDTGELAYYSVRCRECKAETDGGDREPYEEPIPIDQLEEELYEICTCKDKTPPKRAPRMRNIW
jgi:hypothetical protein